MQHKSKWRPALSLLLISFCSSIWAHHGSGISYDTKHIWWTWATVTAFSYINPHPTMTFDRTDRNGNVEHWQSELFVNPSALVRAGWTKVEAWKY